MQHYHERYCDGGNVTKSAPTSYMKLCITPLKTYDAIQLSKPVLRISPLKIEDAQQIVKPVVRLKRLDFMIFCTNPLKTADVLHFARPVLCISPLKIKDAQLIAKPVVRLKRLDYSSPKPLLSPLRMTIPKSTSRKSKRKRITNKKYYDKIWIND